MQQLQLVSVALAMVALVVCGCVLTLKSRRKLPTETDERQPGCFGLEEERGGNWKGSGAPLIKEARPSLWPFA
jgi:hypothetical protein